METSCRLACAIHDALAQRQPDATPALVAYPNADLTVSISVSAAALRAWIAASVAAMASTHHRPGLSLVVALAMPPCSVEESACLLLVASQPHWVVLPLDIRTSAIGLRETLKNVRADVLVTWDQSGLANKDYKASTRLPALYLSSLTMQVYRISTAADPHPSWLEACTRPPLYVLPTSGTTGRAKGVVGTRIGAYERINWSSRTLPMDAQRDVVLRTTRLTFVDAIAEILGACLSRVQLVHLHFHSNDKLNAAFVDSVVVHSPRTFVDVVAHWRITRFTVVPSVLRLLLHAISNILDSDGHVNDQRLASLQVVLVSGEPLPLRIVDQFFDVLPTVTLLNLYGSTEVSGDVTWKILRPPLTTDQRETWGRLGVPIGDFPLRAIGASMQIRLELDASNAEARSEVWVRGGAVAAGYVVGAQLVRPPAQWVRDTDGTEWFCMGDLCRVVNGELFLCGRRDRQVKVRGNRLQLEDVEHAIMQATQAIPVFANVVNVIASMVGTTTSSLSAREETTTLVAILLRGGDQDTARTRCTKCQLVDVDAGPKRQLYDRLVAEYGALFVPHAMLSIDDFKVPRSSNGKVDLRQICELIEDHNTHTALHHPVQGHAVSDTRAIASALVQAVLGLPHTLSDSDIKSTWLQLGGNSMQAVLLSWEADHTLQVSIPSHKILHMEVQELLECMTSKKKKKWLVVDEIAEMGRIPAPVVRQKRKRLDRPKDHRPSPSLISYSRYNQSSLRPENQPAKLPASTNLPATVNLCVKLVARTDLGKCIDASPLIVQPRGRDNVLWAFVGSHAGQFVCLEVDSLTHTSHVKWVRMLDDRIEATATISVDHALVFVGTYSGQLYALDIDTGAVQWTFHARDMIKSSAVVIESLALVIIGAYDQCLYGLDLVSGTIVWTTTLPGSVFSTPVFIEATQALVVATTSGVVLAWYVLTRETLAVRWKATLPAPVFASLVLTGAGVEREVLVGCADGRLYALCLGTGSTKWTLSTSKPVFCTPSVYHHTGSKAVSESAIVGSHDGKLRKFLTEDGGLQWEVDVAESSTTSNAIFASPYVTVLRHEEAEAEMKGVAVVCAATICGRLVFLEESTGRVLSSTIENTEPLGEIFSSPVVVDNHCFVGSRSNDLLVLTLELVSK